MKKIFSLVDFSPSSINAARYAADLALATGGQLVLVNIFQIPILVTEIAVPDSVFNEMQDASKDDLDEFASTLKERTNGKISITSQVATGTIEGSMEDFAYEEEPFAMVMGIQNSNSIERFFLGSSTLHTLRHLSYPILVVPEQAKFSEIKKIGLACDLDHVINIPFDKVSDWISSFNASLDIIHVNKSNKTSSYKVEESLSIHTLLNAYQPNFHILHGRDLGAELHQFSVQHKLDLLLIFPKKHGLEALFGEKHAAKIILNQPIPVLAIHSK